MLFRSHFYVEIHEPAIRVAHARYPDLAMKGDIRAMAQRSSELAQEIWEAARRLDAQAVCFVAGFPCRELSKVNQA